MERTTDELAPDGGTVNSVRRDTYADSVALMRAARALSELPGVAAASLVMGTPANLALLAGAGLLTGEGRAARPGDLVVAVRGDGGGDGGAVAGALAAVDGLLAEPAGSSGSAVLEEPPPRALIEAEPGSALALISTPGPYAGAEALKALRSGMHAFVFSDNVPVEQEIRIKEEAHRRGLLAMGPDCGTAVLDGVPLGFANVLRPGRVGLI
ncbi:transcriptional regulator, partial [Streptomyces sp. A7024]|nr:transcriptional regulator [Streptomyces coryli]